MDEVNLRNRHIVFYCLLCLYLQVASSFIRLSLYVHRACILITLVGILLTLIVLQNHPIALLDLVLFS